MKRWWMIILVVSLVGVVVVILFNFFSSESPPEVEVSSLPTSTNIPDTIMSIGATPTPALDVVPTTELAATPSPTVSTPVATSTSAPTSHTVQSGETPISIAQLYDISVEALMSANNIADPTLLQVNQQLLIPTSQGETQPSGQTVQYQIESGDTLSALAEQYGTTVEEILAVNPGLEPTLLQVDQTIYLPVTNGVVPAAAPTDPPSTSDSDPLPSTNMPVLAQEMVNAINAQRQDNNLPALTVDQQLAAVALAHSEDMVARDFFDHVTPEGKTLRDRLQENGLDLNWVGENIQRNTEAVDQSAQSAVDWFMDSQPHRDNILHENFTHIGVGVVEGPPGWYTFVLVFAQL